jgi:hypothetical protein
MSYIGGSQFSVDNRTNNDLFSCIDRAEMMEQIKKDVMPMGYTGRVQANSSANYARNPYNQLANAYNVNDRDPSLYQYRGFKDDTINASSRATQSASRFNYAYDRQINKRYVDVSGQNIPNNKLRILPNRSCVMWGGGQVLPAPYTDPALEKLSVELMGDPNNYSLDYIPSSANKYLSYKSNRPKLTRQDLMSSAQQYARARSQNLANPPIATLVSAPIGAVASPSVAAFDALESARRRQQMRDEIAANLRESRGMRGGLTLDIP